MPLVKPASTESDITGLATDLANLENAKYVVQTSSSALPNAQALGSLSTGVLKNTTSTGALVIATAGTDYVASSGVAGGQTIFGGTASGNDLILASTPNPTKGKIYLSSGKTSYYDESTGDLVASGRIVPGNAPFVDVYKARGLSKITLTNPTIFHDDFAANTAYKWDTTSVVQGTGSFSLTASSLPGGVATLQTGATNSGRQDVYIGPTTVPRADTGVFYVACRFRVQTAIDNNTQVIIGTSGGCTFGVFGTTPGAQYTTYYAYSAGSTNNVSTIAIDTAWHTAEIWSTGNGTFYFSVDNETPISTVGTALGSTPRNLYAGILLNNATNANRRLDIDEILMLTALN